MFFDSIIPKTTVKFVLKAEMKIKYLFKCDLQIIKPYLY